MAQQEWKKVRRWLLPFTSGVDLPTIDAVLRLAYIGEATLVAVSFLVTSGRPQAQGVRLELIQQSKDFLEVLYHKAHRLSIPLECYEVYTCDVLEDIAAQIYTLACESIVLANHGEKAILLHPHEMQQLILRPPASLVLLRFAPQNTSGRPKLITRLLSWVQGWGNVREIDYSDTSSLVSWRKETSEMISDRP